MPFNLNASITQSKISCKGGTKLSGLFFAANLEAAPLQESEDMIWKMEGTRMCRDAMWQNPKLSKCVDLRALMDSWWNWNNRMAARLKLWTSTFKVMDWFMKPGKYPNWKINLPRSQPTTFYGWSMRPNDPCRLREKFTNSASCAGTKPRGTVN